MDKNGIYECITAIVTKLFSEFCNSMAAKPKDKERDRNLEAIAVILLIEFNNPNKGQFSYDIFKVCNSRPLSRVCKFIPFLDLPKILS